MYSACVWRQKCTINRISRADSISGVWQCTIECDRPQNRSPTQPKLDSASNLPGRTFQELAAECVRCYLTIPPYSQWWNRPSIERLDSPAIARCPKFRDPFEVIRTRWAAFRSDWKAHFANDSEWAALRSTDLPVHSTPDEHFDCFESRCANMKRKVKLRFSFKNSFLLPSQKIVAITFAGVLHNIENAREPGQNGAFHANQLQVNVGLAWTANVRWLDGLGDLDIETSDWPLRRRRLRNDWIRKWPE